MSPRNLRPRKVSDPPVVSGMKPYGNKLPPGKREMVFLGLEEYEALRLCDYAGMNHQQAADQMNVSRPTLTRIYAMALQKIATAMVEGRQLVIEGGKVYFDSEWYNCSQCGCFFNHPDKQNEVRRCALCGSQHISACETDPEGFDEIRGCGPQKHKHRHQQKKEHYESSHHRNGKQS